MPRFCICSCEVQQRVIFVSDYLFNNKNFGDYVKEIYPSQLTAEKSNTSDDLTNYLGLTFIIGSNSRLYTKLYDKRDDFAFHIVNFPFLLCNIPSSLFYGVYISQLIRYARCCSYYDDFGYHHKLWVDGLLSQGYDVKGLRNSFKKFYGRCPDLLGKYQRSVKDMIVDSFPDEFHAVVPLVLSLFNTDFVTWIVSLSIDASCDKCHA